MFAASGSVEFLHSQPRFCEAGWCIGHCAVPVWTHVQERDCAWCTFESNESGAAASSENWQHSHKQAIQARRRRNTFTVGLYHAVT
jgi:hypothetical protein